MDPHFHKMCVLVELNVTRSADFQVTFLCTLCRVLMTGFTTSHPVVDVFGVTRPSKSPHKCPNHVNVHHKTCRRVLTFPIKEILSKFLV